MNAMNLRHRMLLAAILIASAAPSVALAQDQVIHAGKLIDGVSSQPRAKVSIIIRDGKIASVEPGFVSPRGAEIVDLSDATVMPGFIDAHVHVTAKLPSSANATEDWLTRSDIDRGFDGAKFARAMLQQGFTAARDVGGGPETVALRDAINDGRVSGPRLWVSLEPLGSLWSTKAQEMAKKHSNLKA
jgi:imidazolonepropionase-like amidohydrolase